MSSYRNFYLFQGRSYLPGNSPSLSSALFIHRLCSPKLVCFYHQMPVSFRSVLFLLEFSTKIAVLHAEEFQVASVVVALCVTYTIFNYNLMSR